jgi:hypothetical protein
MAGKSDRLIRGQRNLRYTRIPAINMTSKPSTAPKVAPMMVPVCELVSDVAVLVGEGVTVGGRLDVGNDIDGR